MGVKRAFLSNIEACRPLIHEKHFSSDSRHILVGSGAFILIFIMTRGKLVGTERLFGGFAIEIFLFG